MDSRPKYVRSRSSIDDLPVKLPPIRSFTESDYHINEPLSNEVLRSPLLGPEIDGSRHRTDTFRDGCNLDMLADAALKIGTSPPSSQSHRGHHVRAFSTNDYGAERHQLPLEPLSRLRAHSQPGVYHHLIPYEQHQALHQYQHSDYQQLYPHIDATFVHSVGRSRRNSYRPGPHRAYSAVPWSSRDDELLKQLKEEKLGWKEIARSFPGRTSHGCQFRWRRLHASQIKAKGKKDEPMVTSSSDESDGGLASPTDEVLSSEMRQFRLRSPTTSITRAA